MIYVPLCACTSRAWQLGSGGGASTGVQQKLLSYILGARAQAFGVHAWVSPLAGVGESGRQARVTTGCQESNGLNGPQFLSAVGTSQVHWVDKWPPTQVAKDERSKPWAQPSLHRPLLQGADSDWAAAL